jgi:hypothetical protein
LEINRAARDDGGEVNGFEVPDVADRLAEREICGPAGLSFWSSRVETMIGPAVTTV